MQTNCIDLTYPQDFRTDPLKLLMPCFVLFLSSVFSLSLAQNADKPIKLTIRTTDSNNIKVEKKGDDYVITTTGLDPYVFLDASEAIDIKTHPILSFNSFNTSGVMSLVLFVGQLDNDHLIEGNRY